MRMIRLYGSLAAFVGLRYRAIQAEVRDVAEAVQFLAVNFPGILSHMQPGRYWVVVGGQEIAEPDLAGPTGSGDIAFVPVIGGSGAAGKIIVGVALVALAVATAGTLAPLGLAYLTSAGIGLGASLALGGVAQLLTPVPKLAGAGGGAINRPRGPVLSQKSEAAKEAQDSRKNYMFNGSRNTAAAGVMVPQARGRMYVDCGVVISSMQTLGETVDIWT